MEHIHRRRHTMETNNEKVVTFPTTETPLVFGALLKERRKKAHLSQKDFAEMMNVTRNTVINWEADKSKPDYNLIPEICALLNIRIHELFHMQPESGLNDLEERIVGNIRRLSPTSRRVIDKMISAMVDEELLAKDRELKSTYSLFLVRPGTVAAGTGEYVPAEAPKYVFLRKNHINRCADGIVHVKGRKVVSGTARIVVHDEHHIVLAVISEGRIQFDGSPSTRIEVHLATKYEVSG